MRGLNIANRVAVTARVKVAGYLCHDGRGEGGERALSTNVGEQNPEVESYPSFSNC